MNLSSLGSFFPSVSPAVSDQGSGNVLTSSDTQKRILTKMFVHANEENNERQTTKLKDGAK